MKNITEFPLNNTESLPPFYTTWQLDFILMYESGKRVEEERDVELTFDTRTDSFTFFANPYEMVALMESGLDFHLDPTYEQHACTMQGTYYGLHKYTCSLFDIENYLINVLQII